MHSCSLYNVPTRIDVQIEKVLGSGNALQSNSVLQQHTEAVFKLPLEICDSVDAPLGAAMAVKKLICTKII